MRLLKKGDRIGMRKRTTFGWKGKGTIAEDESPSGRVLCVQKDNGEGTCYVTRGEVVLLKPEPNTK
jgi:hypothetical protein